MTDADPKETLHRYLRMAREAMVWKLDGVSEYDVRRPMVPTGTNLLGLVKHLASNEIGYFGDTFGRPFADPPSWFGDWSDPMVDMWATADEARDDILDLYRRASAHADATIEALALEDTGRVPWWPEERAEVTLHHIVVRMIGETNRHAGHADILRELMDGAVGWLVDNDNIPHTEQAEWAAYRNRVEQAARQSAGMS